MGAHEHGGGMTNRVRLRIAIAIVAVFVLVEVVGALLAGSLALLADAGHMFSDLLGLSIALIALLVAARPATDRQTFGFQRAEVFGALLNGLILAGVAIYVAIAAVQRLLDPSGIEVHAAPMLVVAAGGLLANVAVLFVLRDTSGASRSIGMRAASLEVLGDLLGSVAAIVAGVIILASGFVQADAIASLVIAALIVPRALLLLREVVRVLSDSAPAHMDVAEIRLHLRETAGVLDVHDVHVWSITSGAPVFTAHVVVSAEVFASGGTSTLLDELGACLAGHFDVEHSTFQLEPEGHATGEEQLHR
jgi:cobalt-zinc-cadmium efflux system protein